MVVAPGLEERKRKQKKEKREKGWNYPETDAGEEGATCCVCSTITGSQKAEERVWRILAETPGGRPGGEGRVAEGQPSVWTAGAPDTPQAPGGGRQEWKLQA